LNICTNFYCKYDSKKSYIYKITCWWPQKLLGRGGEIIQMYNIKLKWKNLYISTYLLKSLPILCEWLKTVWNNHENPKHKIAPIKKAENTAFSCHWISIDGRLIKSPATHTNAIIPVNYKPPPFSNFLFTNLFSIKFLYFFIISSRFPYFNLFVSIMQI
jgi:hypothetical protein